MDRSSASTSLFLHTASKQMMGGGKVEGEQKRVGVFRYVIVFLLFSFCLPFLSLSKYKSEKELFHVLRAAPFYPFPLIYRLLSSVSPLCHTQDIDVFVFPHNIILLAQLNRSLRLRACFLLCFYFSFLLFHLVYWLAFYLIPSPAILLLLLDACSFSTLVRLFLCLIESCNCIPWLI